MGQAIDVLNKLATFDPIPIVRRIEATQGRMIPTITITYRQQIVAVDPATKDE